MQKHTSCSCKTLFMHSTVQPRSCLPVLYFCSSLLMSCAVSQRQRVPAACSTRTSHLWVESGAAQGGGGFCLWIVWVDFTVLFFADAYAFISLYPFSMLVCLQKVILFLQCLIFYFFWPVWGSRLSPEFTVRWNALSYSQPLLCSFLPSTISQPFPTLLAKNQNKAHPKLVEEAGAVLSVLQVHPFGALCCYFHRQSSVIRDSS